MRLSQLLHKEALILGMNAQDKWGAIQSLVEKLVEINVLPKSQQDAVYQSLVAREKSMSTGMEKGIAVPHAAVDGVEELGIALGVAPKGIPFESIDGQPASIVVLLVIPRSKKMNHIRTLAEVARLLSQDSLRKKILNANSADALMEAIRDEEAKVAPSS